MTGDEESEAIELEHSESARHASQKSRTKTASRSVTASDTAGGKSVVSESQDAGAATLPPADARAGHANRKRKRKAENNDDLESKYLERIAGAGDSSKKSLEKDPEELKSDSSAAGDNGEDESGDDAEVIVHESLAKAEDQDGIEKASRTVFLSNVSTDAITSRGAKKTLLSHLSSNLRKSCKVA